MPRPPVPTLPHLLGGRSRRRAEIIEATGVDNTDIAVTEAETLAPWSRPWLREKAGFSPLNRYGGNTANTRTPRVNDVVGPNPGMSLGSIPGKGILSCKR